MGRLVYAEFKARYNILAAAECKKAKKDKDAAAAVLTKINLDAEKYRLGHTKVFFRAGILGYMEEVREDRIGEILSYLQAQARGKASRSVFQKLQGQKLALYCCQRTIKNWHIGKHWLWWQLWLALKPNLKCTKFAQYKAEYVKDLSRLGRELHKTIIVDNSPASYVFHPDNAVPCSSWFDDMDDRELLDLIPLLEKLGKVDSVYSVLKNKEQVQQHLQQIQSNSGNNQSSLKRSQTSGSSSSATAAVT